MEFLAESGEHEDRECWGFGDVITANNYKLRLIAIRTLVGFAVTTHLAVDGVFRAHADDTTASVVHSCWECIRYAPDARCVLLQGAPIG